MSALISCFWAQVSENFVSDIIESLSFVPAAFDRSPQAWVFGEREEAGDRPHNPHDHFILAAIQASGS